MELFLRFLYKRLNKTIFRKPLEYLVAVRMDMQDRHRLEE